MYILTHDVRDKTLFLTHVAVASVLGVFCGAYLYRNYSLDVALIHQLIGGLYFDTGTSIAGFQSRVGCLFFLVNPHMLSFS